MFISSDHYNQIARDGIGLSHLSNNYPTSWRQDFSCGGKATRSLISNCPAFCATFHNVTRYVRLSGNVQCSSRCLLKGGPKRQHEQTCGTAFSRFCCIKDARGQ